MEKEYETQRFLPEKDAIVVSDRQAAILWDSAGGGEPIGEISAYELDNGDGINMKISSQVYRLEIPNPRAGEKPLSVMFKTSCTGTCKTIRIGGACTNSGCVPQGNACTTHSCGSWCSATCTKTTSLFGDMAALEAILVLLAPN